MRGSRCHEAYPLPGERDLDSGALSPREHSCANYGMRFAPEAGLMRASWDSLFGNLFRACPSPFGRGWREAPGEGRKCTLIRPFGPPSPRGEGHEPPFRLIWTLVIRAASSCSQHVL